MRFLCFMLFIHLKKSNSATLITNIIASIIKKIIVDTQLKSNQVATSTPSTNATTTKQETKKPDVATTTINAPKEATIPPKVATTTSATSTTSVSTTTTETSKKFSPTEENLSADDQIFIDSFYTTYERLFSVENGTSYCQSLGQTKANDMILELRSITKKAGYALPKESELTSFAIDLVSACASGTMSAKLPEFRTRFDTAYPF